MKKCFVIDSLPGEISKHHSIDTVFEKTEKRLLFWKFFAIFEAYEKVRYIFHNFMKRLKGLFLKFNIQSLKDDGIWYCHNFALQLFQMFGMYLNVICLCNNHEKQ